jgi:hypothetical protein
MKAGTQAERAIHVWHDRTLRSNFEMQPQPTLMSSRERQIVAADDSRHAPRAGQQAIADEGKRPNPLRCVAVSAPSWRWQSQSQQRTHDDGNRLTHVRRTGNEVKQVRIDGNNPPTSGNFTLTIHNQSTANVAYNATAATVQARLEARSSIGSGPPEHFTFPLPEQAVYVEFVGTKANQDIGPMSASNVNLNVGAPAVGIYMEGGLKQIAVQHDKNGNMTKVPDVCSTLSRDCITSAAGSSVRTSADGCKLIRWATGTATTCTSTAAAAR